MAENLHASIEGVVGVEWLSTAIVIVLAVLVAALLSAAVTRLLQRILSHDSLPIPSSSIFINIARVAIWAICLSVVLSSCFGIDVSAAIAALGIGGIAISLGFQDTLANLIGGLQVSITGLVHPGDHIDVGGARGVVHDVTWRHTTIENTVGEVFVVPNSIINKTSLTKLRPLEVVSVPFVATFTSNTSLDVLAAQIEEACDEAVRTVDEVTSPARVLFSEGTDYGCRGKVTIQIADPGKHVEAKNALMRALAPHTH